MNNINYTTVIVGALLGYFGSGFVKLSPTVGAALGAAGGFFYGGGTIPALGGGAASVNPGNTPTPIA
jgi:hypothetical protein